LVKRIIIGLNQINYSIFIHANFSVRDGVKKRNWG